MPTRATRPATTTPSPMGGRGALYSGSVAVTDGTALRLFVHAAGRRAARRRRRSESTERHQGVLRFIAEDVENELDTGLPVSATCSCC
jgi:hypothetical protein